MGFNSARQRKETCANHENPGNRAKLCMAEPLGSRRVAGETAAAAISRRGHCSEARGAPAASLSRNIVMRTRHPSGMARRLLTPWMRSASRLATSTIFSPCNRARTQSMVSISNPSLALSSKRQRSPPERHVTVAKIAEPAAVQQSHRSRQSPVAEHAEQRKVGAPASLDEAGSLRQVGARKQGADEEDHFIRVHRPVGIDHDDDVARRACEAGAQRCPFAAPAFEDNTHIRSEAARDLHGVVDRSPVHEDELVNPSRDTGHHVREIGRLVKGRHDDADARNGNMPRPRRQEVQRRWARRWLAQGDRRRRSASKI